MRFSNNKEKFILFAGTVGIGLISLVITLSVYNVQFSKPKEKEYFKEEESSGITLDERLTDEQKMVAQNLIYELEKLEKNSENNTSIEPTTDEENSFADNQQNLITNEEDVEYVKNEIEFDEDIIETIAKPNKKLTFIKPIDGEIGMNYSDERLVYSKTLEEWLTHKAIDFKADVGTEVKAIADGVITEMYVDKKFGFTIVIEHEKGYVSKYSGVIENDVLNVGNVLKQGDYISTVGEATGFEFDEGSHLHFEILKDGVNVEPQFI